MKNKSRKNQRLLFLLALLSPLMASPQVSVAETHFFDSQTLPYIRLDFGQAHFLKVKGAGTVGSVSTINNLKSASNSILGAGLGLGINFGDKFRSDITWTHHLNPSLGSTDKNILVVRNPTIDAYFFNLYYEIASQISIFNPYIGAGIGVARVKDTLHFISVDNNAVTLGSELIPVKNNLAYKLTLGSSFDVNENIKLDLSYSYNDYGRSKQRIDTNNIQIGKTHYRAHVVSLGLRFGT
jgi:opacity protein-like surface antigen